MTNRRGTRGVFSAVIALVVAGMLASCVPSSVVTRPTAVPTSTPTQDAPGGSETATATPTATPPTAATPTGSTPTAAPTLTPTADATTLPVGDVVSNGRTWRQSFAEDFTTPAPLGTVASVYPGMGFYDGFADTSGLGTYAPDKVLSVADGNLDFSFHSENGRPLVAAVMPDGYAPHTTARISIRYKTTITAGYKFVGMLWPSSDQWNDGEIDWPESLTLGDAPRPASAIPGTYANRSMRYDRGAQVHAKTNTTEYHVATTEWDKGIVRFYWDGALVSTTTKAVPTKPMRVTLQGETWTHHGPVPADASGQVSVDWISIWD